MANNNNISSNSNQKGYNLTSASYDMRQEINAQVIGVLKYNNKIREKLLKRNIGFYPQSNLNEGIGYISNLYSIENNNFESPIKDGLLDYTHVYESDYQKHINQKYDIGDEIRYYQHGSIPDSNNLKWNGRYDNYLDYVNEITGTPVSNAINFIASLFGDSKLNSFDGVIGSEKETLTTASILNDILQYDNIKHAMEKTRIGTVNPNPIAALSGAITTNINNFSGKDTPLGVITNYLYARTLNHAAHFNSLRKTKYITPSAYEFIGNKLSTLSVIGADFRIDDETGRIIADFSQNAGTTSYEHLELSDYVSTIQTDDKTKNIADSNYSRFYNLIVNNEGSNYVSKYSPFVGKHYSSEIASNVKTVNNSQTWLPITNASGKTISIWNEGTKSLLYDNLSTTNGFGTYNGIRIDDSKDDLLTKTHKLFTSHDNNGIDTLIGRFHTEGNRDLTHNEASLMQTAISIFGMSHGRNLLTKEACDSKGTNVATINGYDNPYCRTWTYHHQYDNLGNLIRPFGEEEYNDGNKMSSTLSAISKIQSRWGVGRTSHGAKTLNDNTVLNRNGFVNITPSNTEGSIVDIKNCMFSIENLAWKDVYKEPNSELNLSKEQRGPNGGRIMWFPPYDLKFNENVNVNWGQAEFIGRGEKIYTYTNTERSGTLSFIILVDHPSILDTWKNSDAKSRDDDYNEQTLLRFFAGCETLTCDNITPGHWDNRNDIEINTDSSTPLVSQGTSSDIFYIFFPHNYSGYYDSVDDAANYLTNYLCAPANGNTERSDERDIAYKTDKDTQFLPGLENDSNKENRFFRRVNSDNNIDASNFLKGKTDFNDFTQAFNFYHSKRGKYTQGKEILSVEINAYSSSQEYYEEKGVNGIIYHNSVINSNKKRNTKDSLKERRSIFAKKYLKKVLQIDDEKIKVNTVKSINVAQGDETDINAESAVLARCVKIVINYNQTVDKENEKEKLSKEERKNQRVANRIERKSQRAARRAERKFIRQCSKTHPKVDYCENGSEMADSINETINSTIETSTETPTPITAFLKNRTVTGTKALEDVSKYVRWDAEAEYFSMLKDNDSFLYGRIIDKIKYFTPAFHSITPEGFNARLAFLHQCTRQGHTYSVSDTGNAFKSAGNLAFGRPPICVLRIGDFYHTKIVIDSVTIDYENPQWDMNPEGIGMQPMYARISLNFKFLGGSDIEAPISRLQNAISFNYYANQSIYDDRADRGQYVNNKARIKGTPWKPYQAPVANETGNGSQNNRNNE